MKKLSTFFLFLFFFQKITFCQFDFKGGVNAGFPSGVILSVEYLPSEDFGLELAMTANPGIGVSESYYLGTSLLLNGRVYLRPRYGNDRIYIGGYLRPYHRISKVESFGFFLSPSSTPTIDYTKYSGAGAGFMFGKKFVSERFSFFEVNIGVGRNFSKIVQEIDNFRAGDSSIDIFISINLGFRID